MRPADTQAAAPTKTRKSAELPNLINALDVQMQEAVISNLSIPELCEYKQKIEQILSYATGLRLELKAIRAAIIRKA